MQKTIKRFQKIVAPHILSKGEGVLFYRGKGLFAKIVELNDVEWSDNARDIDEHAIKKATFSDEFERIETESVWNHFFSRYAEEWAIFKMSLETASEIHQFDKEVFELIRFHNRSTLTPNSFEIHKKRKHGESNRTKWLVINGEKVVHEPLDFRFTVKLIPKLEETSLTKEDFAKMEF